MSNTTESMSSLPPNTQDLEPQITEETSPHAHLTKSKNSIMDTINEKVKKYTSDILRFLVCIILGGIIASSYFSIDMPIPSANILASYQILLTKGIKGVFPPLSGARKDIIGKWEIELISDVT